jgi:hypothetical protein
MNSDYDVIYFLNLKLKHWFICQLVIPIIFIGYSIVSYAIYQNISIAYEKLIFNGEVLFLGALLFLGNMVDIMYEQKRDERLKMDRAIDNQFLYSLVSAVAYLLAYGMLTTTNYNGVHPRINEKMFVAFILFALFYASMITTLMRYLTIYCFIRLFNEHFNGG